MSDVQVWRYSIPNENGEGWAICFLDSIGCFSVLSDWGDYGYRWPQAGWGPGDFRAFLVKCDDDYVLRKIAPRREYDPEGTLRQVKDRILELRRGQHKTAAQARAEWELLEEHENLDRPEHFALWLERTRIEEAYMLSTTRLDPQAATFVKRVMPRLRERIREDLAKAAPAGSVWNGPAMTDPVAPFEKLKEDPGGAT